MGQIRKGAVALGSTNVTGDTLPIGTEVDYNDTTVPYGWEEIQDDGITVSATEPTGTDIKTHWFQKGKNLFDKNNVNVLYAYINTSSDLVSSSTTKTLYVKVLPSTTYTIQETADIPFRIGFSSDIPIIGTTLTGYTSYDSLGIGTFTTDSDTNYLCLYYYSSGGSSNTEQDILDSIQIEQNATATTYEAYINPTMWILNSNDVYEVFMEKEEPQYINTGSEVTTNEYIDGKRIYRKRIYISALPNATTETYSHGLTGIVFTKIEGMYTNGTTYISPQLVDTSALSSQIRTYITGSNLIIITGTDRSSFYGYIDLYYYYS